MFHRQISIRSTSLQWHSSIMSIGICCAWSIMVPDHIFKAAGWELAGSSHKFFGETPSNQMAGIFQHATEMISGENFNTDLGILVIASSFYQTSSSFIATYPLAISDVNGKSCRKIIHEWKQCFHKLSFTKYCIYTCNQTWHAENLFISIYVYMYINIYSLFPS